MQNPLRRRFWQNHRRILEENHGTCIKVHIWNIEELCYFIRENAWIMEPELLTKELIDWVAQQCGLPKLAVLLNDSLKEEDCVTAFAA